MMGHSSRCHDLATRWDRNKCVPCPTKAGLEVTPNCGYDDYGGRHEPGLKSCSVNTFNSDDSSAVCLRCTVCPPGGLISNCTSTADARCRSPSTETTSVPFTTNQGVTVTALPTFAFKPLWAAPLAISVSILLISACLIFIKSKRGQLQVLRYNKRSSVLKEGFSPLATTDGNSDLEHILNPVILSAPLQTVLDNLDVLEELVILLDPESIGVKNTKHLAAHCSFSSTWIAYAYSMKDSKSPLKAVLEGVTSTHPDWTVGHLAELLRLIKRNDAVAVLSKLRAESSQHVAADCLQEV